MLGWKDGTEQQIYILTSCINNKKIFAYILIYWISFQEKNNGGNLRGSGNSEGWGKLILNLILTEFFLTLCMYHLKFLKNINKSYLVDRLIGHFKFLYI